MHPWRYILAASIRRGYFSLAKNEPESNTSVSGTHQLTERKGTHFHFQMHMSHSALIVVISACARYLPFSMADDDRDKRVGLRTLSARVARSCQYEERDAPSLLHLVHGKKLYKS